ncbi:MAG: glycosyltransferase family 2 protein [Myxococcota bacterium]
MTEAEAESCEISLIIATRNRAESLQRTLESLLQIRFDRAWEVLVIDNGSSDKTAEVLETFSARLPLIAINESEPGKNRALNLALGFARGNLFVFTDDDVSVPLNWLSAYFEASRAWPTANIFGGPIRPVFPEATPDWISAPDFILASEAFGIKPIGSEGPTDEPPYGANLAMRAALFDGLSFDENIGPNSAKSYAQGSEYELMKRLQERGEEFIHVPGAPIDHMISEHQVELDWLHGRAERIGRGSARIKGKHLPRSLAGWIPLFLRLQKARWLAFLARGKDASERFSRTQRVHYWQGYISEARVLAPGFSPSRRRSTSR